MAVASALAFAVTASAQSTVPNPGALDVDRYDDGTTETVFKVQNPNGGSDYFSVDMDLDAAGKRVVGLLCSTTDFGGGVIGGVGLYGDNLGVDGTGHTPDLTNLIVDVGATSFAWPVPCVPDTIFDVVDQTLPSSGLHVVLTEEPFDTTMWLCTDTGSAASGRGFFSLDGYATPAIAWAADPLLGVASDPSGGINPNTIYMNGGTVANIAEEDDLCVLFAGDAPGQPWMIFISNGGGVPLLPAVNVVIITGIIAPIDDANTTASACAEWPCGTFTGTIHFMGLYKPSAGGPVAFSNEVQVNVSGSPSCQPCTTWGQRDDGVLDTTIWKVQNPAGSFDYFNVHHGPAPGSVSNIIDVEVASWDFCGTGPSWAEVGTYDANIGLDPTGGTPDLSLPVSTTTTNTAMAASAAQWGYPATVYDTPDAAPGAADISSLVHWAPFDTCTWIGSDMDGIDGGVPASCIGPNSFFTLDGYATAALQHAGVHYMQRINWN